MRSATCHPDRKHYCKGLCDPCYQMRRARARGVKPHKEARSPGCHPERKHAAHGLCGMCWQREKARRNGVEPPRPARIPTCHPDRKHQAAGLCAGCYANRRYATSPEWRESVKAKTRERYRRNPQKAREEKRAYYLANRESLRRKTKVYYETHREKMIAAQTAWAKKHSASVNEKNRAWRKRNPAKAKAMRAAWEKAHPEEMRALRHLGRSRRRGASGKFTPEQLRARFAFFGDRCAYCGTEGKLSIDHVIPLARGGSNWPANLRPACLKCNSSKCDRKIVEWRAVPA